MTNMLSMFPRAAMTKYHNQVAYHTRSSQDTEG